MKRTPTDYARWVMQFHEVDSALPAAVDLEDLADKCGVRVDSIDLDGCSGLLLRIDGASGILLNERDSRRRRRFTLAHELGHFCIPKHAAQVSSCMSPEPLWSSSERSLEREANDFAVELLMPRRTTRLLLQSGELGLSLAARVSETFDVTLMAAALRVSELTREPTAVVYTENNTIRWAFRHGFPYGLPSFGDPLPRGSAALEVASGTGGSLDGIEIHAHTWLPVADTSHADSTIVESSFPIGERGGVITMLWMPDEE